MKPVEQQELAVYDEHGDAVVHGDCMRASVASLFELDLEDVPHFAASDNWWNIWMDFLAARGLRIGRAFLHINEDDPTILTGWPGDLHWLASVKSPRVQSRCSACKGKKLVTQEWDSGTGEYVDYKEPQPCQWCKGTGLVPGLHMVVMYGRDVAWDPHPQRNMGHLGFTEGYDLRVIDPAKIKYVG